MSQEFDVTDFSTWANALRVDHAQPQVEDRSVAHEIASRYSENNDYSDPQFKKLLDGNALRTTLNLLCDNCLAGFSKEELTDLSEEAHARRETVIVVSCITIRLYVIPTLMWRTCSSSHMSPAWS